MYYESYVGFLVSWVTLDETNLLRQFSDGYLRRLNPKVRADYEPVLLYNYYYWDDDAFGVDFSLSLRFV